MLRKSVYERYLNASDRRIITAYPTNFPMLIRWFHIMCIKSCVLIHSFNENSKGKKTFSTDYRLDSKLCLSSSYTVIFIIIIELVCKRRWQNLNGHNTKLFNGHNDEFGFHLINLDFIWWHRIISTAFTQIFHDQFFK